MEQRRGFVGLLVTIVAATVMLGLVLSQEEVDSVTVNLTEHEQFGGILTDEAGRSLYLFENEELEAEDADRMTEGIRSSAAPCTGGCLDNWPPLLAAMAMAGEGVDAELLYVEDVDGSMQVVYNGWPLYFFARDAEPGDVNGQGLGTGNVWYLVNAEGMPVEEEDGAN
jgi:predicted lipoprotein with Yx(FWY)xxD motif